MVIRILPSRTGGTKGGAGVSYKFADTYDNGRNPYAVNTPIERNPYHDFTFTYRITEDLRSFKATPWVNQATPVGDKMQRIMLYSIPNLTVLGIKLLVPNLSSREPLGGGASTTKILMVCPQKLRGLTVVMRTVSSIRSPVLRRVL